MTVGPLAHRAHRWVIPVCDALCRVGGQVVVGRWIAEYDLVRLGGLSTRFPLELEEA